MTTRRGKIARLPRAVREELNGRLLEGEPGNHLVNWLNEKEEVQAVLKEYFGGRSINEQNLSDWKQGGYEDWQRHQESLEVADRVFEEAGDYGSDDGVRVADRLAGVAAASMGRLLDSAMRMEDGADKQRATIQIVREVTRLRHADRESERAIREESQWRRKTTPIGALLGGLEAIHALQKEQSRSKKESGAEVER